MRMCFAEESKTLVIVKMLLNYCFFVGWASKCTQELHILALPSPVHHRTPRYREQ